jgi:hypothetical protein
VGILLYADDIVLIANSPEELQSMLDIAHKYACKWHFRFNAKPGKSDVVVSPFAQELVPAKPFVLGTTPLHVSQEYKYLGVEMGQADTNSWKTYLARAERKAKLAMFQLLHSVRGSRPLQLKTSLHLFKTLVRPVMGYADGVWGAMCSSARGSICALSWACKVLRSGSSALPSGSSAALLACHKTASLVTFSGCDALRQTGATLPEAGVAR